VDTRIEEEIHATLRRLLPGRTTILVARRRSTLRLATRIVVVDEGRVVDSGTHEELLSRSVLYRRLLTGPDADGAGDPEEAPAAPATRVDGVTPELWERDGEVDLA